MSSESSAVSGVAGRYAAALFELAEEQKKLDEVAAEIAVIRSLLAESDDLRRLVASPVLGRDAQGKALLAVLEKAGVSVLTRNFAGVVARNRRLFVIDIMCIGYRQLLAAARGEITAEINTALPLTDSQRTSLEQELRSAVGSKVTLDTRVDASLLGGMIVKVGSRMIDSSLRAQLQRLEISLKGAA